MIITIPEPPKEIHEISEKTLQSIHDSSLKQLQLLINKFVPQLSSLSTQNQKTTAVLNEINQFMGSIEEGQNLVSNKIEEIKATQDDLNYRLNMTCIRMRDVITKQSNILKDVTGVMEGEVELNKERVVVLENYTNGVEEELAHHNPRATVKTYEKVDIVPKDEP